MVSPSQTVDRKAILSILHRHRQKIKLSLQVCAHCGLCAESCFMFAANGGHYKYMPAYKMLNSMGVLYKKKGRVDRSRLAAIRDIVWKDCVLCTRCYCPMGIDIPHLLSLTRQICRSQDIYPDYTGKRKLEPGG